MKNCPFISFTLQRCYRVSIGYLAACLFLLLAANSQAQKPCPVGDCPCLEAKATNALKDATRRLRRWPREAARPSLTAATRLAWGCSGRDEKTALQPNQKTGLPPAVGRTTHALQTADIFTRQRHRGRNRAGALGRDPFGTRRRVARGRLSTLRSAPVQGMPARPMSPR